MAMTLGHYDSNSYMFYFDYNSYIGETYPTVKLYVRPVINLNSTVAIFIGGKGTPDNPYVVTWILL